MRRRMALAQLTFTNTDPSFARTCLQAGMEVYRLGRAHEGVQQGNSYSAPYRYAETTWADDMEWGAAALMPPLANRIIYPTPKHSRRDGRLRIMDGPRTDRSLSILSIHEHRPLCRSMNLPIRPCNVSWPDIIAMASNGAWRTSRKNPYGVGVPFIWCSNNLLAALVTQCAFTSA